MERTDKNAGKTTLVSKKTAESDQERVSTRKMHTLLINWRKAKAKGEGLWDMGYGIFRHNDTKSQRRNDAETQ